MRAETELFKDKIEVSLDGRQVFYLFFGGAVIASLVFVLGVMVGKRVEARAHVDSRPATSAARDPLAALDQLTRQGELAFPSALAGTSDAPLGAIDRALADRAPRPERPATAPAEAGKADSDSKARTEAQRAAKAAKVEAERAAKADEERAARAEEERAAKAEAARAAKADEERAARADADDGEADESGDTRESRFTLQLSSFRDRVEADSFHAKLTQAGYAPYIVEAEVPDKGTWYRVRLGGYDSYDAAIAAKKEFEASQQIIAYVTRIKK